VCTGSTLHGMSNKSHTANHYPGESFAVVKSVANQSIMDKSIGRIFLIAQIMRRPICRRGNMLTTKLRWGNFGIVYLSF